jgi:nucleotide-binding universal stress UspA family protein
VVCGVTSTGQSAPQVARVAADLAERLDLPLTLSHVLDINDGLDAEIDPSLSALLDSRAWTALRLMLPVLDEIGYRVDARAVLRTGDPADELIALGRDGEAALIVVGCRGHGPLRTLLEGSISLELCQRAPCAVVIVPPCLRRDR